MIDLAQHREDYAKFLLDCNTSAEEVQEYTDFPNYKETPIAGLALGPSEIEGTGVFATQNFGHLTNLGKALDGETRSMLGRYVNHGRYPNAFFVKQHSGDIYAITGRDILAGEEITYDYRQTLWVALHAK